MKLRTLLKEITPLPWLEVAATDGDKWIGTKEGDDRIATLDGNTQSLDHIYLVHTANVLPELVAAAKHLQENWARNLTAPMARLNEVLEGRKGTWGDNQKGASSPFHWLLYQKLRPILQQLLSVPKAPERSNRTHLGGVGGLHVNARISDVEAFRRCNPQPPSNFYGTGVSGGMKVVGKRRFENPSSSG